MTRTALKLVWKLVAIEALALAQAADLRSDEGLMGGDYRKLHELVRSVSPALEADRPLADEIQRLTQLVQTEEAQQHCLRLDPAHRDD
jgi:histidine ammonia-lyase